MSELKVNKISPRSGTAITLGDSGDTFTIPSGATLAIAGSVTGFTSAGIDDNATSVAITIDSSENVGIKNTTMASFSNLPATDLVVGAGSTNSGITIYSGTSSGSNIGFADATSGDGRNQGIIQYHHNGDYMRFFTSASEKMRILSDGKVGISTSSPNAKLDVTATTNNEDLIRLSHPSSPGNADGILGFNSDGTTDNNVVTLGVVYSGSSYDVLNIKRSTQFVGIGTVNPQEALSIENGDVQIHETGSSDPLLTLSVGNTQASPTREWGLE